MHAEERRLQLSPAGCPNAAGARGRRARSPPAAKRVPTARSAPCSNARQHAWQQGLVVLQVAIHDGDSCSRGCQHALDARPGQPAPADAPQAAHARIRARKFARRGRRTVRAVVVDEDDFPSPVGREPRSRAPQPAEHSRLSLKVGTTIVSSGTLGAVCLGIASGLWRACGRVEVALHACCHGPVARARIAPHASARAAHGSSTGRAESRLHSFRSSVTVRRTPSSWPA